MPKKEAPSRRRHLSREDRRTALLDVAVGVVEKQGWPALSMISVAEAAQVSRQLVYQHFGSVEELMKATMSHIFRDVYEGIVEKIQRGPGTLDEVVMAAENLTFDLPPNRAHALWQILTATNSGQPDAARASLRIRHLVAKMWTPTVRSVFDLGEQEGKALAWMLCMAFWGGHQLVSDGEIGQAAVTRLFLRLLQPVPGPKSAVKPVARRRKL